MPTLEPRWMGSYGQVLDAVKEVGPESLDRSGHLDMPVAREEFLEDNAQLEPGEAGAEAEVGSAAAEGDVGVGRATYRQALYRWLEHCDVCDEHGARRCVLTPSPELRPGAMS